MEDVRCLARAAAEFRELHGSWPAHDELLALEPTLPRLDRWRRPFRYAVDGAALIVATAGIDGVFGSCDDIASAPVAAQAPRGAAATGQ